MDKEIARGEKNVEDVGIVEKAVRRETPKETSRPSPPKHIATKLKEAILERYELRKNLTEIAQVLPAVKRELFVLFGQYLDTALNVLVTEMQTAKSSKVRLDAAYRLCKLVESIANAAAPQTNIVFNMTDGDIERKVEELRRLYAEAIKQKGAVGEGEGMGEDKVGGEREDGEEGEECGNGGDNHAGGFDPQGDAGE